MEQSVLADIIINQIKKIIFEYQLNDDENL